MKELEKKIVNQIVVFENDFHKNNDMESLRLISDIEDDLITKGFEYPQVDYIKDIATNSIYLKWTLEKVYTLIEEGLEIKLV